MSRARIALLPDGRRLHLQDGPIDLIIEAFGAPPAVQAAYRAAAARFVTTLDELCAELPLLRQAAAPDRCPLAGVVARRMHAAVAPFAADGFITPMAAVAGAVAEEILGAMTEAATLARAYVNNGGDIAFHLSERARFDIGMVDRPESPALFSKAGVAAADPVRGIATSGRHGRSFSLGIADAVTVLSATAAMADAAATVIANAVDLPGHPAIRRAAANALQPDSDLGARLVTRHVERLMPDEVGAALAAGIACVRSLAARGLIEAAALHLQGRTVMAPHSTPSRPSPCSISERALVHG